MKILIFKTSTDIKAWLVNEPIEAAPAHIANGYPHLAADYAAGLITAQVVDVIDEDAYFPDLFTVVDGQVILKEVPTP